MIKPLIILTNSKEPFVMPTVFEHTVYRLCEKFMQTSQNQMIREVK